MPLTSGTKLGPYEIQSALGAGGMAEVYRARDSRLSRTVAIKVLPDHLSSSPEARQRFEREARTISSLNHPHICQLYDIGSAATTRNTFLEMNRDIWHAHNTANPEEFQAKLMGRTVI